MIIIWQTNAENKLFECIEHIGKEAPETAKRIYQEIIKEAELLADFPQLGKKFKIDESTRILTVKRNFKIVYKVKNDSINVLHFQHTKQKSTMK